MHLERDFMTALRKDVDLVGDYGLCPELGRNILGDPGLA
jgi:hypothetical protein